MELDKRITALILMDLGYEVKADWKFKIRADERTPSASINSNGKIKDFGSGWYGDIIDFLENFCGYSKINAFNFVNNYKNSKKALELPKNYTIKKEKSLNNIPISQDEIEYYKNERKNNFARFLELLNSALPSATKEQRKEIAITYELGYDPFKDRLIMPIRDINGDCATLWKYNPNPKSYCNANGELIQLPKVLFSSGRQKPPFNIANALKSANENKDIILITEGEKDCLNALCKGINAFSIGSATSKLHDKYLPYFRGKKVFIAYDYDESGIKGAKELQKSLTQAGAIAKILNWEFISNEYKCNLKKGFDVTDFLVFLNNQNQQKVKRKVVEYGI